MTEENHFNNIHVLEMIAAQKAERAEYFENVESIQSKAAAEQKEVRDILDQNQSAYLVALTQVGHDMIKQNGLKFYDTTDTGIYLQKQKYPLVESIAINSHNYEIVAMNYQNEKNKYSQKHEKYDTLARGLGAIPVVGLVYAAFNYAEKFDEISLDPIVQFGAGVAFLAVSLTTWGIGTNLFSKILPKEGKHTEEELVELQKMKEEKKRVSSENDKLLKLSKALENSMMALFENDAKALQDNPLVADQAENFILHLQSKPAKHKAKL